MIFPSNTLAPSYPENKSSSYSIPLDSTLISKNSLVGLSQVQIPLTFYNLEGEETITIEDENGKTKIFHVKEGIYKTGESLASMLQELVDNSLIITWSDGFEIRPVPGKMKTVKISPKLSRLLSVPRKIDNEGYRSKFSIFDPWVNQRVLFVKCNLSRALQVNEQELQVLGVIVPTDFTFGGTYYKIFHPINFLEVEGNAYNVVSFSITDLDGDLIKFRSGNVIVQIVLQT
jgi:hypothetical protein